MAKKKNPDEMTVEELRVEAASKGVEGRSGMSKAELVAALSGGDDADATDGAKPAPYPPPPSDQSGEPGVGAVPPTKKIPTPAPASENEPPKPPVPTAAEAIAASDAERARLQARVTELERLGNEKGFLLPDDPASTKVKSKAPTRKATVTPQHGSPMEVEYPADTPKDGRDQAAIEAWKVRAGIWSPAATPHVDHGEK